MYFNFYFVFHCILPHHITFNVLGYLFLYMDTNLTSNMILCVVNTLQQTT